MGSKLQEALLNTFKSATYVVSASYPIAQNKHQKYSKRGKPYKTIISIVRV